MPSLLYDIFYCSLAGSIVLLAFERAWRVGSWRAVLTYLPLAMILCLDATTLNEIWSKAAKARPNLAVPPWFWLPLVLQCTGAVLAVTRLNAKDSDGAGDGRKVRHLVVCYSVWLSGFVVFWLLMCSASSWEHLRLGASIKYYCGHTAQDFFSKPGRTALLLCLMVFVVLVSTYAFATARKASMFMIAVFPALCACAAFLFGRARPVGGGYQMVWDYAWPIGVTVVYCIVAWKFESRQTSLASAQPSGAGLCTPLHIRGVALSGNHGASPPAQQVAQQPSGPVSRGRRCPCGSKKKYKHCHGLRGQGDGRA